MNSIVKAIVSLSVLALASAAPAYSKDAARPACPSGYARFESICISTASGDIVLPTAKKTVVSSQAQAER